MNAEANRLRMLLLQYTPVLLFLVLVAVFASLSDRFLTPSNFINIVTQAAHIAIIAIGMTFVLLVAGIDRLVGMGWLPGLLDPLWNSSSLLDDSTGPGRVLADLAGYRAQPSLTTLGALATYWLLVRRALARRRAHRRARWAARPSV